MRNLTGPQQQYRSVNDSDGDSSVRNPFGSDTHTVDDSSSDERFSPQFATPSSRAEYPSANTPVEFDRYPHRISSMASNSGVPLLKVNGGSNVFADGSRSGSHTNSIRAASRLSSNSASDASSLDASGNSTASPFVVHADFSPFGGYPASSFPLHLEEKEADDYLHNPDPILDAKYDRQCVRLDRRSGWGACALLSLMLGGVALFIILPVLTYSGVTTHPDKTQTYEILTDYTYSHLAAIRTNLVDPDTPADAMNITSKDGDTWNLVFSDEFALEGRTFYDGDDQFWTAVDIHYAATQDLEWYDPDAVTTVNGTLYITLDAFKNHNLMYRSGMVQSWNKMCFTQGKVEFSANLAGSGTTPGLWPGLWTMGNLARPGYLASSHGTWPYSYDACDAGITPNQSSWDGISYQPGQRLSACTCTGEDHPNPGTGRGAPEIDALEGTVSGTLGVASQSLQLAPYDIWYIPNYEFLEIHNTSVTCMNTYAGGPLQQAISGTTMLNSEWYELNSTKQYQRYAYEYLNDDTNGYIRWFVGENPSYTLYAPAIGPNGNVDTRHISKEPMSMIINLGISNSWTYIDWNGLTWPSHMSVDFVRIYQPSDAVSLTCDPTDYPTSDYINNHLKAYENANLTSWPMAGYDWPKNKLTGCS